MSDYHETVEYKGFDIRLYPDEDSQDPRDWDNIGTMVCFHKQYTLGDTDHGLKSDMFDSWEELQTHLIKEEKAAIILPLYLYDHSGLRMKVGSFNGLLPQGHAEFDSGQVGFIYITRETIKKEMARPRRMKKGQINPDLQKIKHVSKKDRERIITSLKSEVDVYDKYLSGDVWGYVVEDPEGHMTDESHWGYFGFSECEKEAKSMVDWMEGQRNKLMQDAFELSWQGNLRTAQREICREFVTSA
jgi:hypothetical protein